MVRFPVGEVWSGSISPVSRAQLLFAMWIWVILVAVTLGIAYLSVRPGDCVIKCRGGEVTIKGKITHSQQIAVKEYLERHFAEAGRLRISLHYPKAGRRLRVDIRGSLAKGDEQMIRNFILAEF